MDNIQIIYLIVILVLLFLVAILAYLVCEKDNKKNDSFEALISENENNVKNNYFNEKYVILN